jgi:hypothetical protein
MDNTVELALVKYGYSEISNQQLADHMGFSQEEQRMLTMFWEPAFNGSWIYLSPEMITKDMGYKHVPQFYKDVLINSYIENVDYVNINKTDELVKKYEEYKKSFAVENSTAKLKDRRGGSNIKYYKITGRTLKKMLMKCGTKKGDQICDYYLKVEQLAIFMKDYIVALHKHIMQKQIDEKDAALGRMNKVNIELLTFKKNNEKNESIYIVATYRYASQGIFKIGRTKCMKERTSTHNNTHIANDKVKVLKEFKVNDSVATENYIHRKLKGLLVKNEKEFFVCPYDLLENIIEVIITNDESHNNLINSVIDTVYQLKCSNYSANRWMNGIDTSIFREEYQLVETGSAGDESVVQATFDITNATETQKKAFVSQCVQAYRLTIQEPNQLIWKTFQAYLIDQLHIPKYRFKALHWKPLFNEANDSLHLTE